MPNHLVISWTLRATSVLLCILLGTGVALAAGSKPCDAFTEAQAELMAAQKDFLACATAAKGNSEKCREKGRRVVDLTKQLKSGADSYCDPKPPCEDEALRGTDKNEGSEPKYRESSTVCTITEKPQVVNLIRISGGACSVKNVFDVLIRTPSAIGPTTDDDQPVENCGVLTLMGSNKIKVEIDEERHRVSNYTLPSHEFYPGRVIRQIVQDGNKVKVITIGTGTLKQPMKAVNWATAPAIWLAADERLKVIFARAYAVK